MKNYEKPQYLIIRIEDEVRNLLATSSDFNDNDGMDLDDWNVG